METAMKSSRVSTRLLCLLGANQVTQPFNLNLSQEAFTKVQLVYMQTEKVNTGSLLRKYFQAKYTRAKRLKKKQTKLPLIFKPILMKIKPHLATQCQCCKASAPRLPSLPGTRIFKGRVHLSLFELYDQEVFSKWINRMRWLIEVRMSVQLFIESSFLVQVHWDKI